ncbi:hypothetical protein [Aquimarina longa]|uniref:hypothetical protein n=1 Tax=Aquimarina longa TaxID=1080221 RepID=UPI0007808D83|nr:hypothetical protein [Aquimarina longa]
MRKNKGNKETILHELLKKKKYYTEEAFEILSGDLIDDLEIDTDIKQVKFESYIQHLTAKGINLQIIQNGILSGINSEYLSKRKD